MNFPTLPYDKLTYSFLQEIWFWGPTHPTFLYDVTLFTLFFWSLPLDKANTTQVRVCMKDSNISLEQKRGTIIENKSESGANEGNFYDELFFCYNCKSIFVSEVALEEHQERMH